MAKILLIGKHFTRRNPDRYGGVIVLFKLLKRTLTAKGIDYLEVDTNWRNYGNPLFAYISILLQIVFKSRRCTHLSLHCTTGELILLAPFVVWWAKRMRKKVSVRKFAGRFIDEYESYHGLKRRLVIYALKKADTVFFETQYLVRYFKRLNRNAFWFPNVREKTMEPAIPRAYRKRFVFLGYIRKEKGIDEILEASLRLGSDFVIDLYGSLCEGYVKTLFQDYSVDYRGVLSLDEILPTLDRYDVLLLPSYREGYPGVIIEAFSLGIPVIASRLEGIQEMVTNRVSGLLIRPKDVDSLVDAMESIDEECYSQYSLSAYSAFDKFDSHKETCRFLEKIGFHLSKPDE